MEREFEAKALISKQQFELLISKLEITEIRQQKNIYLDSNNFFKNKNSALRLRIIDGQYIFSLKRQDRDGATEWNQNITAEQFQQIIDSKTIDFGIYNCPDNQVLSDLDIICIDTTRYVCSYQEQLIELDKTTFNKTIDFEIEIEADSLDAASQTMKQLATEFALDIKKSYPKIARYFMYN